MVQINVDVPKVLLDWSERSDKNDWKKAIGKAILRRPDAHLKKVKNGLKVARDMTSRGDVVLFSGWTIPIGHRFDFLRRGSNDRTLIFEKILTKEFDARSYVYKNGVLLTQDVQQLSSSSKMRLYEQTWLGTKKAGDDEWDHSDICLFSEPRRRGFNLRGNLRGFLLLCGEANIARSSVVDKKRKMLKNKEFIYDVASAVESTIEKSHLVFNPSHAINPPAMESMRRKRGFIASKTIPYNGKHWLFQVANGHIPAVPTHGRGYLKRAHLRTAELYLGKRRLLGGKYRLRPDYPEKMEDEKSEGFTIYLVDLNDPANAMFYT
jgi:hypothetical protein